LPRMGGPILSKRPRMASAEERGLPRITRIGARRGDRPT
jgi:hypothetical protein